MTTIKQRMLMRINGKETLMKPHFSSDTRFYDSWATINDKGQRVGVHSLPKNLKAGQRFRTRGNNYEVIRMWEVVS